MLITDTTICAVSTAPGVGAIATIRIAGPEALSIVDKVFRSPKEGKQLSAQRGGTFHYGTITDGQEDIDEVVVAVFKAPYSFTGEDIAEITCHGSVVIQRRIIQVLLQYGARMAKPGEFTQRAFANGKMDLSQAEAVADLIASQSDVARKVALRQMKGGFSEQLKALRGRLLEFTSLLELELDFPEEDVEFADRTQLLSLIVEIEEVVSRLAKSFVVGNAIKNGVPVAIVGPTNAGKSTLLNALLGEERAIVSDIHGTTRDTIEDTIDLEGFIFRFIDTAGIRKTEDTIENIGIERTYSKLVEASVVILMLDSTSDEEERKEVILDVLERLDYDRQKLIIVYNKKDLAQPNDSIQYEWECEVLYISARDGDGIKLLQEALLRTIDTGIVEADETIVTNMRHYEALVNSQNSLCRVREGLECNSSGELVAMDIHEALDELGSITGEVSSQDVLNNIFKNFCIGK